MPFKQAAYTYMYTSMKSPFMLVEYQIGIHKELTDFLWKSENKYTKKMEEGKHCLKRTRGRYVKKQVIYIHIYMHKSSLEVHLSKRYICVLHAWIICLINISFLNKLTIYKYINMYKGTDYLTVFHYYFIWFFNSLLCSN